MLPSGDSLGPKGQPKVPRYVRWPNLDLGEANLSGATQDQAKESLKKCAGKYLRIPGSEIAAELLDRELKAGTVFVMKNHSLHCALHAADGSGKVKCLSRTSEDVVASLDITPEKTFLDQIKELIIPIGQAQGNQPSMPAAGILSSLASDQSFKLNNLPLCHNVQQLISFEAKRRPLDFKFAALDTTNGKVVKIGDPEICAAGGPWIEIEFAAGNLPNLDHIIGIKLPGDDFQKIMRETTKSQAAPFSFQEAEIVKIQAAAEIANALRNAMNLVDCTQNAQGKEGIYQFLRLPRHEQGRREGLASGRLSRFKNITVPLGGVQVALSEVEVTLTLTQKWVHGAVLEFSFIPKGERDQRLLVDLMRGNPTFGFETPAEERKRTNGGGKLGAFLSGMITSLGKVASPEASLAGTLAAKALENLHSAVSNGSPPRHYLQVIAMFDIEHATNFFMVAPPQARTFARLVQVLLPGLKPEARAQFPAWLSDLE